ncbi:MAG TPA: KTSC domain-containing protein [Devosia sp.]|nr:KTSC domain-containing protein [Devosia sp.]
MSSVIRHIHYQTETQELSLWLVPEGKRYIYSGVPEPLYQALRAAPSRGAFFNRCIRDRFDYRLADVSERRFRRWQAIRSAS